MMQTFEKRSRQSFGQTHLSWLKSYHHFSFGDYFEPQRHRFGVLRVVNDDTIAAGTGFDMHHHKDMEIITYVTQGAVHHRDSLGNAGITQAGSVQIMSAGSGISHAEFADKQQDTHLFQIWITPSERNLPPRWDHVDLHRAKNSSTSTLLASGMAEDLANPAVLRINQAARLIVLSHIAGDAMTLPFTRSGYAIITQGNITIDGQMFETGDAIAIATPAVIKGQAGPEGVEILVLDLPLLSQ